MLGRLRRIWSWRSPDMANPEELPSTLGISRDDLIAALTQVLSDKRVLCDHCDLGSAKSNEVDFASEAFSLCFLSFGCIFLVKAAYSEYRAYHDMKNQEGEDVQPNASGHTVTMGEFIKYRWSS